MTSTLESRRGRHTALHLASAYALALVYLIAYGGSALGQPCSLASPVSWVLGANGNWGIGANWSNGVYPNNSGTNVCITDHKSLVTLNVGATVGSLQLGKGNTITMALGTSLDVAGSQIVNSGRINVNAGSAKDTIFSISNNVSLSGGVLPTGVTFSSIVLNSGDGGSAYIRGAGHTLTNVDNIIEGAGYVGDDGLNIINGTVGLGGDGPGQIDANSPGGTLNIGAGGGSFINAWGVEVAAGSTLKVTANQNGFDQIGGSTWVDGNLIVPHGLVNEATTHGVLNGQGLIAGFGAITGNVINAGILDPEYFSFVPGTLTIVGDYEQQTGGNFYVFSGETNQLQVDGAVVLGGALDIFGPTGVQPIMGYESYSGNFSALDYNGNACTSAGADLWTCEGFYRAKELFGATNLTVDITGIPEPSTWVMMLAGFAGLGFAAYRTSRSLALR